MNRTEKTTIILGGSGKTGRRVAERLEPRRWLLDGHNAHVTDGVERALGHPPLDFRSYARGAAKAWRS